MAIPNFQKTDDTFTDAKPVIGRMYHIRGMYKGSYFRLLDLGQTYAVLGWPHRHTHKTISCKISDLKEIRARQ